MNTVVNQLVKEAAYHAAKYDSTIQAINALAGNGMNKTASGDSLDMIAGIFGNGTDHLMKAQQTAGDLMEGLSDPGVQSVVKRDILDRFGLGGMADAATNIWNNHAADAAKRLGIEQNIADAIASRPGIGSVLGNTISGMAADNPTALGLAGIAGLGVAGSALAGNRAAQQAAAQQAAAQQAAAQQAAQISQLKSQLAGATADNGSLLANLGQRLSNAGSSAWNAIKNNPGTSAAVGAGAAGLAALPFLMGGEKEGSYDPNKLAALRQVLNNM